MDNTERSKKQVLVGDASFQCNEFKKMGKLDLTTCLKERKTS